MDLEAQAGLAFDAAEAKDAQNTDAPVQDADDSAVVDDTADNTADEKVEEKESEEKTEESDEKSEDTEEKEEEPEEKVEEKEEEVAEEEPAEIQPAFDPNSTLETFVYEGLEGITVIGKDGQEYQVKVPEELPDDFEFRTVKEEKLFDQAMIRQASNAQELVSQYNTNQQVAEQATYNNSLKSEIDSAIEAGRIPKFDGNKLNMKGKGEVRAQQVLDFMNEQNQVFAKAGKSYRLQSFDMALTLLEANEAKAQLAEYQKTIDDGKKGAASMTPSGTQAGSPAPSKLPLMPRGMNAVDFVNMIDE